MAYSSGCSCSKKGLRKEGEVLGTRQSGLSDLALANLVEDEEILAIARTAAISILAIDPELKNHPHMRVELERRGYSDINASLLN